MEKENLSESNKIILLEKIFLYFLFAVGFAVRLYKLGTVPYGLNQDEAFAGYNAYSLLHYGIDASGYHNPVYFIAWGSGMNALETYLMIPFIKWLGLTVTAIRLPQAILGCLSIIVFYLLLKEFFSPRMVILGVLIFIACPWHIMKSRWALESNLAPEFLLYGFYFFIKGLKNNKFLCISALCYGLCLYCYAVVWIVIPVMILFQMIYCISYKKISLKNRYLVFSFFILLIMALPLVYFLLVNKGFVGEINKRLISVPKLTHLRMEDLPMNHYGNNFLNSLKIIYSQSDNLLYNTSKRFGTYYHFSNIFVAAGFILILVKTFQSILKRNFSLIVLLAIEITASMILCFSLQANINRINIIWIGLLLCIVFAIDEISRRVWKNFSLVMAGIYLLCFILFLTSYFSSPNYPERSGFTSVKGQEILDSLNSTADPVFFDAAIPFPAILFYSQMPTPEFLATIRYLNADSTYRVAYKFGKFVRYKYDVSTLENGTYILSSSHSEELSHMGYTITDYGPYVTAVK